MTWTDSVIPSKGETRVTAKETTYAPCSPPLLVLPVLPVLSEAEGSEAEGSVAEGSGGVRGGRDRTAKTRLLHGRLALPHPRFRGGKPSSASPYKGEEKRSRAERGWRNDTS